MITSCLKRSVYYLQYIQSYTSKSSFKRVRRQKVVAFDYDTLTVRVV